MMVDAEYHGKLRPSQVPDILKNYRTSELALTKEQQKIAPIAQKPTSPQPKSR
jgi:hypothetical protein